MLVPQLTRPRSQHNTEQSNEMARCHPSSPDSVSRNNIEGCPAINLNLILSKESTPVKDVDAMQLTRPQSQLNADKSYENGKTPPLSLCFCFLQWYWKMSSNKSQSRFVKRVNTHEGCWYHRWQHHDPSLMLSNQMKMARHHPFPPVSVSRNDIGRCPAINLNLVLSKESTPVKDVGTTDDKTTIPV